MSVALHHGDMLEVIPRLVAEGVVVDACVTDPPYHLTGMAKRWSRATARAVSDVEQNRRAPGQGVSPFLCAARGFMGQQWDGGDIAFRPETWATVATILRPGAFLIAFGGTRTYHRLTCAIEDAGFVIQDCLMWLFGTGFPKRRDHLKPAWESIIVARKTGGIAGDLDIIGSQVERLRSQLWSILPASDAERFSVFGAAAQRNEIPGSAPSNASENRGQWTGVLSDQMDTPPSELALITSLSTVSSWSDTLAESSIPANTFIIETELSTTIDWITLRSCLSEITPESIIQAHRSGRLSIADAEPAVSYFNAELKRLAGTLELSALAPAISKVPLHYRAGAVSPECQPIVLAYKPGGARAMQIDECRIGFSSETDKAAAFPGGRLTSHGAGSLAGPGTAQDTQRSGFTSQRSSIGRWPANVCHDGSDEVVALFPQSAACKTPSAARCESIYRPGQGEYQAQGPIYGDDGSAARFFFSAKQYPPCALCGWPCAGEDDTLNECSPVSNAADNSSRPGITPSLQGFVPSDAPGCTPHDSEDTQSRLNGYASNAGSHSPQCRQLTDSIAPESAHDWPLPRIVQNVKSAAHLCGLCATAIAQSLAASRQGHAPESPRFPASISETSKQILFRSLALYVEGRESTDTILTTQSLKELFGSVLHAIAENINSERNDLNIGSDQPRFRFSSKAGAEDRWGSKHPTVKPVDLMKWLVQLVTPQNGIVLDPFAGSGTTGVAALATGRNAILIEREEQYRDDISERLAFYEGDGLHSTQAKNRNRKVELGPLFAGAAE